MSSADAPSEEKDQEDEGEDPEGCKDLKTSQSDRRTISALSLIREDLSQFKEGVLKVFKEKDLNPKTSQPVEKPINSLSLLREDLNNFKDDLSTVFRMGLLKEREDGTVSEDASSKTLRAERADEPLISLFRRSLIWTSTRSEVVPEATNAETSDKPTDEGSTGSFTKPEEETTTEDVVNKSENCDLNERSESLQIFSQEQQTEETMHASNTVSCLSTAVQSLEGTVQTEDLSEESEDKASESFSWETLSSGIPLFSLKDAKMRDPPGEDLWALKNFACYLTLDPNTANSELNLTDGNRTATRIWLDPRWSEHPERFQLCPQVLCREGLLDSVYWEVVWSGGADVGVTYNTISRSGEATECLLGHNLHSWSLECSEGSYTPCHNQRRFRSTSPEPFSHRVGIYLDWSSGTLSFYCITQDAMIHLHTFTSTFTEPLYPGFWVWAYHGSVSLSQVELDWERLLQ